MKANLNLRQKKISNFKQGSEEYYFLLSCYRLANPNLEEEKFEKYFSSSFQEIDVSYQTTADGKPIVFYGVLFYCYGAGDFSARAIVALDPEMRGSGLFDYTIIEDKIKAFYRQNRVDFPLALQVLNPIIFSAIAKHVLDFSPKPTSKDIAFAKAHSVDELMEFGKRKIEKEGFPPFIVDASMQVEFSESFKQKLLRAINLDNFMKLYVYWNPFFFEGKAILTVINVSAWVMKNG